MSSTEPLKSGLSDPTVHITSHNSSGKAIVHSSSKNDWSWFPNRGVGFNVVYTTDSFPVSMNDEVDIKSHQETMSGGQLGLVKKGGTVCRIVDFGPNNDKPLMHRTQSLDYGIVLEGSIEMELDDGSVTHLNKGDIAVQRGTNHAWRNPSKTEWTRMLFVLQDSQPVVVGGEKFKEDLGDEQNIPKSGNDD